VLDARAVGHASRLPGSAVSCGRVEGELGGLPPGGRARAALGEVLACARQPIRLARGLAVRARRVRARARDQSEQRRRGGGPGALGEPRSRAVKIALDAQLTIGTATGIGEYVGGLANALEAGGIEVVRLVEPRVDPWRFDRRVYWDQVLLPQRARASGADLLHCAAGTMPLTLAVPAVVTVHDVAWSRVQAHARPYARYYFGAFSIDRYRNAQRIVVDSEFSRAELLDAAPRLDANRMSVVYPGVADDYMRLDRRTGDGRT